MKELNMSLNVEGGRIDWNYDEVKKQLSEISLPEHIECKTGQAAYYFGIKLNEYHALIAQVEAAKERYTNEYLQSVQGFRGQMDNVITILKKQESQVSECLEQYHETFRQEKRKRVREYFDKKMSGYGAIADKIIARDWFWEEEWTTKKISNRKLYQSLDEKISAVISDLEAIKAISKEYALVLMLYYTKVHDMKKVSAYCEELIDTEVSLKDKEPAKEVLIEAQMDLPKGDMEYRFTGSYHQVKQLEEYARFIGGSIRRTKNNMPKGITNHEALDFDSFVSVDLENSGSMGLANGDQPSEIIEIGAVRYKDGIMVDQFSTLVNPGRPIVPIVQTLTGITDEMVADQPTPQEAVKMFLEFAGDAIWLGHDLKNSDIPFLERAARKSGIYLEREYFDTYEYAQMIKEEEQFEKMRLSDLANYYGIAIDNIHRACDDAELTAKLYFAMKNRK